MVTRKSSYVNAKGIPPAPHFHPVPVRWGGGRFMPILARGRGLPYPSWGRETLSWLVGGGGTSILAGRVPLGAVQGSPCPVRTKDWGTLPKGIWDQRLEYLPQKGPGTSEPGYPLPMDRRLWKHNLPASYGMWAVIITLLCVTVSGIGIVFLNWDFTCIYLYYHIPTCLQMSPEALCSSCIYLAFYHPVCSWTKIS